MTEKLRNSVCIDSEIIHILTHHVKYTNNYKNNKNNKNNNNTRSSTACFTHMSRHALQKMAQGKKLR